MNSASIAADLALAMDRQRDGAFDTATGHLRRSFAITRSDIVFDAGCGSGDASVFCAQMGAKLIYTDVDAAFVTITKERLAGIGARRAEAVSTAGAVADNSVSKVLAIDVLHRVEDPARLLAELVRIGRPGAVYLIAVPNPTDERLGLASQGLGVRSPIDCEAIGALASSAGLVVEESGAYGFYQAMRSVLSRVSSPDREAMPPPILASWAITWRALLQTEGSERVRRLLNELLPSTRYVLARKPAANDGPIGETRRISALGADAISSAARRLSHLLRSGRSHAPSALPPTGSDHAGFSRDVGLHDAVESGWFDRERNALFRGFAIDAADIVLDAGCGNGDYSSWCAERARHIIFSDIDARSVQRTRDRLAGSQAEAMTPIVSDANPLPLPDGTVSKVISNEVIEHVDDPALFLSELARVGRSGALYLLAVPDPVQEALQRQLAPAEFFVKPPPGGGYIRGLSSGHLRTVGRDEFEALVRGAGLIVERHDYVGFFWSLWFAFFWICNVEFSEPMHPLLLHWTRTWKYVLDLPDGRAVKAALDAFLPKSQIIIARKP